MHFFNKRNYINVYAVERNGGDIKNLAIKNVLACVCDKSAQVFSHELTREMNVPCLHLCLATFWSKRKKEGEKGNIYLFRDLNSAT